MPAWCAVIMQSRASPSLSATLVQSTRLTYSRVFTGSSKSSSSCLPLPPPVFSLFLGSPPASFGLRVGASIVVEGRMVFWRACRGAGTRAPTTTQERRRAARRMASSGPTVRVAALHRALRMASGAGVARRKSIEARVRSTTTSCLGNSAYGLGLGRQTPGRDQF